MKGRGRHPESDALHARVRAFMDAAMGEDAAAISEVSFDRLALDIARFQARNVVAVRRLAARRGVDLDRAVDVAAIPALPSDVFRFARVAAHGAEDDEVVFRTSGTTGGSRGNHALRTCATYDRGALAWGREMLFPDRADMVVIALAPPPGEAPDSSLVHMLALFASAQKGPATWHLRGDRLLVQDVIAACAHARSEGRPALVVGTSFAFVYLLDALDGARAPLPARSRAMQTGGFKGRSREVPAAELRSGIAAAFAIPERAIVGEYGMTELSSQLYEGTLERADAPAGVYFAPPWVRVTAVDPETLAPVPRGEMGLARIVDLANVDSSVAIQTADLVRAVETPAGPGFALSGRMPGATPRGCSLAVEEALERDPRGAGSRV